MSIWLKKLFNNPYIIFAKLNNYTDFPWIPDKLFLTLKYHSVFGKKINWRNPKTFNEKLQWLKLYDRREIYTIMADKYEVKKFVGGIIGEEHIVPTYGIWDSFDDIDFEQLPQQFVLKCTHDSGGLVICNDKNNFDRNTARKKIERSLSRNYFYKGREWPYKNIKPRILAEKYLTDELEQEPRDYKFFCFGGEPRILLIASERHSSSEVKVDFFDMDFNRLDIFNGHPNYSGFLHKPTRFEEMKQMARSISVGIPQVRVDFYEVNSEVYFGEMTFYHHSGMTQFDPTEWDEKMGDWIYLPKLS